MIRVSGEALTKVLRHALSHPRREVAGLLIGREKREELLVTDAVTGHQKGSAGHVTLDDSLMATLSELLEGQRSQLYVVGWYHTHPGMGVFLSAVDYATQLNYQRLYDRAVALVVDPWEFVRYNGLSPSCFRFFRITVDSGLVVEVPSLVEGEVRVLSLPKLPASSSPERDEGFVTSHESPGVGSSRGLLYYINEFISKISWWRQ
ncbi:MAG: Mov34/MPN/PAD-1 family protein [Thaumarchaeota archaeon]|nr:Mov34/MPN/PAD-1 family protein [Candidatus Calditenuaceae archaeon]MDW8042483.1 Mov34/MPN/PAD-1 family protein [Nitrososphaerota archaeon]